MSTLVMHKPLDPDGVVLLSPGVQESSKAAGGGQQALCTMYAMSYDSKVWIEGHGLWYQGLASISPRYEFDVLGGLGLKGHPVGPSRVFSALTVQLTTSPAAAAASAGGPSPVAALTTPDEDCECVCALTFVMVAVHCIY